MYICVLCYLLFSCLRLDSHYRHPCLFVSPRETRHGSWFPPSALKATTISLTTWLTDIPCEIPLPPTSMNSLFHQPVPGPWMSFLEPSRISGGGVVQLLSHVRFFCDPMDYSPPGSSVHGIFQKRMQRSTRKHWLAYTKLCDGFLGVCICQNRSNCAHEICKA